MRIIIVGEKNPINIGKNAPSSCTILEKSTALDYGLRLTDYYRGDNKEVCNGNAVEIFDFPETREELGNLFKGKDVYVSDDEDLLLLTFCLMTQNEIARYAPIYPITYERYKSLREKSIFDAMELIKIEDY